MEGCGLVSGLVAVEFIVFLRENTVSRFGFLGGSALIDVICLWLEELLCLWDHHLFVRIQVLDYSSCCSIAGWCLDESGSASSLWILGWTGCRQPMTLRRSHLRHILHLLLLLEIYHL